MRIKKQLFRIHEILVWIGIRICGSMHLTNGSRLGSGSFSFRHGPSRRQEKDKKSQNSKNQALYCFCLVIEGSRSGSTPLTNGSGFREAQKMWIRWIRIRIRIRNTETNYKENVIIVDGSLPVRFESKILQELLVTVLTLQTAVFFFDMFHERLHFWK